MPFLWLQELEMELRDLTVRGHMLQEERTLAQREAYECKELLKQAEEEVEREQCTAIQAEEKFRKVRAPARMCVRCKKAGQGTGGNRICTS